MSERDATARAVAVKRMRRAYTRVEVRPSKARPGAYVVLAWIGAECVACYG